MLRHIVTAAILLILAATVSPAAQTDGGGTRIVLRESVIVSGDLIEVGDVADVAGAAAAEVSALRLGNAPWPGHARKISRVLVKVRLASEGYDLQSVDVSGSHVCVVKLDSVRVESEEIVAAARQHLESRFPEGGPEVTLELLNEVPPVVLAAGEEPIEFKVSRHGSAPPVGTVRVDVELVRAGARLKTVPVSLMVRQYKTVAVARRRIAPGENVSPAKVTLVRREIDPSLRGCVCSTDELSDQVAGRTIYPGQIITRRALRAAPKPVVIEHNQRVFLIVETETLRAVTLGKSMQRARAGELVRVRNLSSNREVVGIAADDSTVHVLMGGHTDGL
jgi:flagella basal body P-ring formation protein FlgA